MLLLASCMKSKDNNVTLASDTAITSFSLGTMKRIVHTTSSTGADSTYKVSVTGSDYKFSIDQVNQFLMRTHFPRELMSPKFFAA